MNAPMRVYGATTNERFWAKVDKTGECWVWNAAINANGYGKFGIGGRTRSAHRVSYEFANGPIPDGLDLDHMCHIRACVNPGHLRLATTAENNQNRQSERRNNASGTRGVSWMKAAGKWRAHAGLDGRQHYLGLFADLAEAEAVVINWRREHMPYSLMDQRPAARE